MIDIKAIDKNETLENGLNFVDSYKGDLKKRGDDPAKVDQLIKINSERKSLIHELETSKANQNKVGPEIAKLKKEGKDASEQIKAMGELSGAIKALQSQVEEKEAALRELIIQLPNKLHPSVPEGQSEEDNVEVRKNGEIPTFSFSAREHHELGENLGIIDFERAGKVTGARFSFLKKQGAQLERALIQFFMDVHSQDHGYEETIPPFIANSDSFFGTGQFPKFVDDVFHLEGTEYHLVPTAEVPVTNLYRDEILQEEELPAKFVAYSPCFRSEAGSYGRDTKGLIRQHQFNKVELMVFSHPDRSYEIHEELTGHAEKILQLLELPYRTVTLCSKDIGFGAAKCYDIEVWLPGQNSYREISSCSNFEDFQARRANIRYRPNIPKAKPQFVHTLNGSGLAVGRTLIGVLENYQQEDGSVLIPEVLQKYMGGKKSITA